MIGRSGGTTKEGDGEKFMEADMSLSGSSGESKKRDRLLLFVVLLRLLLLLLVVVLAVVVLDEVVTMLLLILILILLSAASIGGDIVVAYEDLSSWQQFELEVTSEFCSVSWKKSGSQSSKYRALIGLEISSCNE